MVEVEHRLLQVAFSHLTVRDPHLRISGARSRTSAGQALDILDPVVHEEDLTAPAQSHARSASRSMPGSHLRTKVWIESRFAGGVAMSERSRKARKRHVEGARDRRCGQGENIDLRPQGLESFLLAHAEAMLLVDYHESPGA